MNVDCAVCRTNVFRRQELKVKRMSVWVEGERRGREEVGAGRMWVEDIP